jgi:hypothetical protein
MAYRSKTYICFDGDKDMTWYRLMQAWKDNENCDFNFHNAHDLNSARDSSQEESIKRQLRERFANSRLLIVLIGESTKFLTKFVKWEMEVALRLQIPIIGVNINKSRAKDSLCPPIIRDELALFVPFGQKIVAHAMDFWPDQHRTLRRENKSGSYYLADDVYRGLGLEIKA